MFEFLTKNVYNNFKNLLVKCNPSLPFHEYIDLKQSPYLFN